MGKITAVFDEVKARLDHAKDTDQLKCNIVRNGNIVDYRKAEDYPMITLTLYDGQNGPAYNYGGNIDRLFLDINLYHPPIEGDEENYLYDTDTDEGILIMLEQALDALELSTADAIEPTLNGTANDGREYRLILDESAPEMMKLTIRYEIETAQFIFGQRHS